jgi:hypothetical protein
MVDGIACVNYRATVVRGESGVKKAFLRQTLLWTMELHE